MRSFVACSLLLLVALVNVGCGWRGCTAQLVPSIHALVVDEGVAQKDAKLFFSIDGGPTTEVGCDPSIGSGCSDVWFGVEASGIFTIRAESADGTKEAIAIAIVEADACHVETREVTLELK